MFLDFQKKRQQQQIEFSKIHNIMSLLNLCSYAVEIRYPDDWYEPTIEETLLTYPISCRQAHHLNWIAVIQVF